MWTSPKAGLCMIEMNCLKVVATNEFLPYGVIPDADLSRTIREADVPQEEPGLTWHEYLATLSPAELAKARKAVHELKATGDYPGLQKVTDPPKPEDRDPSEAQGSTYGAPEDADSRFEPGRRGEAGKGLKRDDEM